MTIHDAVATGEHAFDLTACDVTWSVYRFVANAKPGMMAVRQRANGHWEIGFFRAGEYTPEQVKAGLEEGAMHEDCEP